MAVSSFGNYSDPHPFRPGQSRGDAVEPDHAAHHSDISPKSDQPVPHSQGRRKLAVPIHPSVRVCMLRTLHNLRRTVDPKATDVEDRLAEWQHFRNWDRLHMALGGNTPIDHICERLVKTPLADERAI